MSPRKQVIKTSSALSSGGDGDCVEADDTDEEMFQEELPHSSMSLSRRRERVVKAKPKEMSEEEMMDLALRLSEQEASNAAAKRQQEEEAMTEALKESMFSQTQPCASPPSQRYHGNTDPSPKLPSRRQLAYPATVPKNVSLAEELSVKNTLCGSLDPRGAGNHKHNMRKRKREDGVPVLERADLPQTQKICSQSSTLEPLCSQTDPCLLPKTFKPSSSASKLHVQLPRLSPGILKTCRTSGFVVCSQQSLTSTQTSLTSPSNSPTFPSSATNSDNVGYSKKPKFPKSADCSDPDVEVIGETDPRFNCPKSPVFGRVGSTKALDNTSTAPKSPVFGRVGSTKALDNTSTAPKSPVFGRVGSTKALDNTSTAPKSPVFGMVESTRALDNRCIAAKSPVFARVESTKASDYENQIAASVTSQKSLPTCDDDKFPEGLKFSKLSRSKRPIHSASNTLSKGLTFPKSPALTGKGEAKDLLRDGCSVRTEHCGTSPLFVKSRKVSGETRPDFREESPRFGKTSLPKTGSGRSSPVFGRTSPVLGRTSPVFGRTSPVFGSTRTERSSILLATIGQESSSQDSCSAISNKESRQPRQCLQKTNGLNHKDAESESTSPDHVGKPTTAALAGKEKPTKKDEESIPEIMKMTSDMTLHWSESEEDLEQSEGSPSPVFPEERRPQQAEPPTCSPEHSGSAPSATSSHSPKRLRLNPVPAVVFLEAAGSDTSTSCPRVPRSGPGPSHPQEPSSRVPAPPLGSGGGPLVHYFWGVPFCPQGLDPDRYTQVILAQMEVYEKSLKNAQRGLLRKAEWGAGITPTPEEPLEDSPELIPTISLRRPGLRSRRRAAGVKPSEEEDDDEDEDEGGREEDVKRKGVEPVEEAEEDLDVVGCDMCPVSHRPSKRRALKSLATEDRGDGDPSGHGPAPQGRERCYVCHKSVPLAEYSRHTESCIQRQRAHTASPKGDLLSALEKTERRHPEP
uniref:BRCA1-A complex subunit RAP80 n=1 Tax=Gadus morhua TaxID=8049 RepID=A0A8C5FFQ8_GADMO